MARFTKYWPTANAIKVNPVTPSTYRATFIGWDALSDREEATEATEARDLGKRLSATDLARFEALEPGQRMCVGGIVYAYD